MKLGLEVGLALGHVMSDRDPAYPKGAQPPSPFLAHVHYNQTAEWNQLPVGAEVGLGPGDVLLDGDPGPTPKKGHSTLPLFSAYVSCGQTAGWIKMPLGMEVGLGPGYIVDWDRAHCPQKGGTAPPFFGQCLLWP